MYALDDVDNAERALSESDVLCFTLAASAKSYLGTVCMFAKMLSVVLFLRQSPLLGVIYIILCISKCQYVINLDTEYVFSQNTHPMYVCMCAVHCVVTVTSFAIQTRVM